MIQPFSGTVPTNTSKTKFAEVFASMYQSSSTEFYIAYDAASVLLSLVSIQL